MDKVIIKILNILGNFEGSQLSINFYIDEIWIDVYENSISIIIDTKNKYCYLDCETSTNHLTKDMVLELGQIMELIEENIDLFLNIRKKSS